MQTTSSLLANTCNTSQRRAILWHWRPPTFASQTKIHQVLLTTNLRVAKYSQNHYTEYLAWNNMKKITNSSRYWHRTDSWILSSCSPSVRSCRRLPLWRNAHQTVNSTTQVTCSWNSHIPKAKHNFYAQKLFVKPCTNFPNHTHPNENSTMCIFDHHCHGSTGCLISTQRRRLNEATLPSTVKPRKVRKLLLSLRVLLHPLTAEIILTWKLRYRMALSWKNGWWWWWCSLPVNIYIYI